MLSLINSFAFEIYVILAYLISWTGWFVLIRTNTAPDFFNPWKMLAAFGPSIAGLVAIYILSGTKGLRRLWHQLVAWRNNWVWYLLSLAGPPALMLVSLGIHILLGGEGLMFNDPAELYRVIPVFLLVFFFSVLGEEIGWRGFALPWLQARLNALQSSIILGVLWALWHLPLYWIPGDFHQQLPLSWFILQIMATTILITWIYNATQGSLFMVMLFHAASNTAFGVLPILPEVANNATRQAWILDALLVIAAVVVILLNGPKTLTRQKQQESDLEFYL